MSNWREQLSEESESKAIVAWLTEYYHIPTLVFLFGFAFWNRIRNWSNFVIDGDVFFSGNDPWYHYRSTQYAVENNLATMPFDPWTYFPFGTSTGQFGTLFDQLIALTALIVGLGSPSESLVGHVFLVAPAFFGLAICIPAYLIGARLGGRFGGLVTVGFVALAPDRLLQVSLAGNVQHHSAEVLFMSLSILGVMVALAVAEREKPVFELVTSGDIGILRGTIGWSMLAGIAMGLYLWAWPPGLWIFGILGAFFVVHLSISHVRGTSPEHAAFVGVISMVTAGILQLSTVRTLELGVTSRSILQPGLAFFVAAGIFFLAWLSREVEHRDLAPSAYPGIVAGLMITATLLVYLILPDIFSFFFGQVDRIFGFITTPGTAAGTIGEAQPPADRLGYLFDRYQLAVVTAAIGALIIIARQIISERRNGEQLLILVFAVFMVSATFTQVRFGYYLTIPIGALNAVLVSFLMKTIGSATTDHQEFTIESYQVMTIAVVILVMFVPLLGVPWIGADVNAVDRSNQLSQPGDVMGWEDSLSWMAENTPEEGQYANPDGDPMELYGTFDRTDDHEYPDGAYGVLSWWDYGHWITAQGERIPNANPFQQGASQAADFLLAQDETEALDVMEENFDDHENAQTRYVMVDWKMAETETSPFVRGKFFAPAEFHSEFDRTDLFERILTSPEQPETQQQLLSGSTIAHQQAYYESMITRLYHYHGSHAEPRPVGVDRTPVGEGENPVVGFESMEEAREWADAHEDRTVGGIGTNPEEPVDALEHFRLVHLSDVSALGTGDRDLDLQRHGVNYGQQNVLQRDLQNTGILQAFQQFSQNPEDEAIRSLTGSNPAWTKTFERVPGATITIEDGPANQELTVSVPIVPENGEQFTYEQRVETDSNGEATTTVPYATEGYEEWGVDEGYTKVAATASDPYTIMSSPDFDEIDLDDPDSLMQYVGTANVTEGQVIGEDDSPVSVSLDEQQLIDPDQLDETDDGENGTDTEEDGQSVDEEDGTDGDESTTDEEDGTEDDDESTTDEEDGTGDGEETTTDEEDDTNDDEETSDE